MFGELNKGGGTATAQSMPEVVVSLGGKKAETERSQGRRSESDGLVDPEEEGKGVTVGVCGVLGAGARRKLFLAPSLGMLSRSVRKMPRGPRFPTKQQSFERPEPRSAGGYEGTPSPCEVSFEGSRASSKVLGPVRGRKVGLFRPPEPSVPMLGKQATPSNFAKIIRSVPSA